MLLWLGCYICLSVCLSVCLCLVEGFRPRFHSVWSRALCNCLVKKISQCTDVLTHKHTELCLPPLLALCVLKHICRRLIILTGGKNSHKIKIAESGQLAVGSQHPPLRLQMYFLSFPKMLIALTACMGREGVREKVGPVVKWASHYY